MRIAVTPADRELARLDLLLADRLGEDVAPRVKLIAEADLSALGPDADERIRDSGGPRRVWLDDETGEVLAVRVQQVRKESSPQVLVPRQSAESRPATKPS